VGYTEHTHIHFVQRNAISSALLFSFPLCGRLGGKFALKREGLTCALINSCFAPGQDCKSSVLFLFYTVSRIYKTTTYNLYFRTKRIEECVFPRYVQTDLIFTLQFQLSKDKETSLIFSPSINFCNSLWVLKQCFVLFCSVLSFFMRKQSSFL